MEMLTLMIIGIILLAVLLFWIFASIYTVVPADEAHVVVREGNINVYSSHPDFAKTDDDGKKHSAYFHIPSWFFLLKLGMEVHKIPLKMITINVPNFLAFDKDRARFVVNIIAYVTVRDPIMSAKRFSGHIEELKEQISRIVQSTTRDATTKKTIREIINDRESIIDAIKPPLQKSISSWGVELQNIELVEFRDPEITKGDKETSHVIQDISSIIEEQINSESRQKNAEQKKIARLKEAEADEEAQKREIMRDEAVGMRKQEQAQKVAEKEKVAKQKEYEVIEVQKVRTQEIEKRRAEVQAEQEKRVAIIKAEQMKEAEEINKQQKKLEGEGYKLKQEETAKGDASPIIEKGKAEANVVEWKGLAEAKALDAKQKALNQFKDEAIRALVAEKIVEMSREVGIEGAKALANADVKVFSGSDGSSKEGFDVGKMLTALGVSNESLMNAVMHRVEKPNDLGINIGKKEIVGNTVEQIKKKIENSKVDKSA